MNEKQALPKALGLLRDLLGAPLQEVRKQVCLGGPDADVRPDFIATLGSHQFVFEYKAGARADQVGGGLRQLQHYRTLAPAATPLLIVPHMGEVGKMLCQEAGVSWLDLSGNAQITAPGLRIVVEGKPNRFKERGRPANLFAPVSSRIARVLLVSPDRWFTQQELAHETGMSQGGLSRLLPRYDEAGFVERRPDGRRVLVRVAKPNLLLDAWRDAYDFSAHDVRRGHIAARSGVELLKQIAARLAQHEVGYAATGLAAAWLIEPFAGFRLVTVYLREWPRSEALAETGFRDDPRGANVWLVLPRDEGVFAGGGIHAGIHHVSAVQTYLDLKAQPERAEEAAEELRKQHLKWSISDGPEPALRRVFA